MNIEEFEKSKKELLKAKKDNDKKISIIDERTKISKLNSFDNKALVILGFSMIEYLLIFPVSLAIIKKIGVIAFTNIIPTLCYPVILSGSSFGIGFLINFLVNKKFKIKEKYKSFSNAKTNIEKLQEEVYYQIELEKANNRNKSIDMALNLLESNKKMLNTMPHQYELDDSITLKTLENEKIKSNELSDIFKEKYNKLDILSTQKVLFDNFCNIKSKLQKITDIMLTIMLVGIGTMIFTSFPLIMLKEALIYSSLFKVFTSIFAQVAVFTVMTGGYMVKRNKNHEKVFDIFNSKLGENALEKVGDVYEKQNISRLIQNQINDISLTYVLLQEHKSCLDTFTVGEENTKKQNKTNSTLDNLERKNIENTINYDTIFPDGVYGSNYCVFTTNKAEKGPTLVKIKKYKNSIDKKK